MMAINYITAKFSLLPRLIQPTYDAIFSTLPFSDRWRLLLLQPLNILIPLLTSPYWLFSNRYSVIYIPTRSGPKRVLVIRPPDYPLPGISSPNAHPDDETDSRKTETELRPLHIDIHGGAFIGGFPEQGARWCSYLSDKTGAVIISCTHRIAPRHIFPAAHHDIDDIFSWVVQHAESELGADPKLLTVGGSSAGGNLALSGSMHLSRLADRASSTDDHSKAVVPKAAILFCPAVDLRVAPKEKPKPANFPTRDPLFWLHRFYDAYAGPDRVKNLENPRLNLIVAKKEDLPRDMFFVIAGIDVLAHEELSMVERLRGEIERDREDDDRRVEARVWDGGFHGWLELPKSFLEKERMEAFDASVVFIKDVHRKHGFKYHKS